MECLALPEMIGDGNMYRDKMTVLQLFRTARVLERSDYVAVEITFDRFQVLKHREYKLNDIITISEHNELLHNSRQPIILDLSYLETDEKGLVIMGW